MKHPRASLLSPEERYTKKLLWQREYRRRIRLTKEPDEPIRCDKCGMVLNYNFEYKYNLGTKAAKKKHLQEYHSY